MDLMQTLATELLGTEDMKALMTFFTSDYDMMSESKSRSNKRKLCVKRVCKCFIAYRRPASLLARMFFRCARGSMRRRLCGPLPQRPLGLWPRHLSSGGLARGSLCPIGLCRTWRRIHSAQLGQDIRLRLDLSPQTHLSAILHRSDDHTDHAIDCFDVSYYCV